MLVAIAPRLDVPLYKLMFRLPLTPFETQEIAWVVPKSQASPPAGEVSVSGAGATIENTALLTSYSAALAASLALTKQVVEGVSGTVHA